MTATGHTAQIDAGTPESRRSPDLPASQRSRDDVSSATAAARATHAIPAPPKPLSALDTIGLAPLPPPFSFASATRYQLLTARTVADMLGVCAETVLRWIRDGELPAIRLPGGAVRVAETELNEWLVERATPRRGVLAAAPGAARTEP